MKGYGEDFKEVAHCGGQVTFDLRCDAEGRISMAAGIRHSSPGPAAWIGIYVLMANAQPVQDFVIGGLGQGFNPPMPDGCWPVFLGSDSESRWGHRCPRCKADFRNAHHPAIYPLSCPYCGLRTSACSFLTPAQHRYVSHYMRTVEEAFHSGMTPNTEHQIVIDMDRIADLDTESRPEFYYTSETQQTRFTCEKCGEFNDIRGVYGYCAGCGYRNNGPSFRVAVVDLREKLNNSTINASGAVQSSVSKFDSCCRDLVAQLCRRIPMKSARRSEFERLKFHDIENEVFKRLQNILDVDALKGVSASDTRFLKLMLHRRHIYEHNDGVMDERYATESGDEAAKVGVLVRESNENVHRLFGILSRVVESIQRDFHEIFPLTEWPVKHFERGYEGS